MVERQDDIDRFLSLAMCYNRSFKVIEQHYFQALIALHFYAVFCQQDSCVKIKLLLLYWKHNANVNNFIQNLRNILNEVSVDMVHGGFNVNYFSDKDSAELKSRLEESLDFQEVVKKPTFISGSLLDHVYVKLGKFKNVTTTIISVYYSDHDTVRISL